jgi:phosphoribosylanthranilate isomerase
MLRVKICGLTTPQDAAAAIEFGADALGFNFYPGSKRYLLMGAGSEWIAALPGPSKGRYPRNASWDEARVAAHEGITAPGHHGAKPRFAGWEEGIRFEEGPFP